MRHCGPVSHASPMGSAGRKSNQGDRSIVPQGRGLKNGAMRKGARGGPCITFTGSLERSVRGKRAVRTGCLAAEPFQPAWPEVQCLFRLFVRRPTQPGLVVDRLLSDRGACLIFRDMGWGRRSDEAGECGQPYMDGRRIIIDDVVDPGWTGKGR